MKKHINPFYALKKQYKKIDFEKSVRGDVYKRQEEEQRLLFVGITRAKEHLELSYYTSPGQYRAAPGPSRYLRMIPGNLIEGQERERE